MYSTGNLCAITHFIQLKFIDKLMCIIQRNRLPLLIMKEVQKVVGAHLSVSMSILSKYHINFLTVSQQIVEVLNFGSLQSA